MKRKGIILIFAAVTIFLLTGNALAAGEAKYVWPTPEGSRRLSRGFGGGHTGLDIAVPVGTPVYASASGTVVFVYSGCGNVNGAGAPCKRKGTCSPNHGFTSLGYCNAGFGNGVVLKHDDGSYTAYAHLSPNTVTVQSGERVIQGQEIGKTGSSGVSTGPHLHFEMLSATELNFWSSYNKGNSVDPLLWLNGDGGVNADTKGVDTITETSAILRGEVWSVDEKITECGMYIGTSEDTLTLLGSDKGLSTYGTPCYYSTEKYKYSLRPGTTYYYQVYAVAGKRTVKGKTRSFITDGTAQGAPERPTIRLSTVAAAQGEPVSVSWEMVSGVDYTLSYWKEEELGSSAVLWAKSPATLSELEPGSYRIRLRAQNEMGETESEELTFLVKEKSGSKDPEVRVITKGADNITGTGAIVRGDFTVTGGRASECGMYLGTSRDNMTKLGFDNVDSTGVPFYYSTGKYGMTLKPGTTYYYQAYAVVNGTAYWGEKESFTTAGTVTVTTKKADSITAHDAIVRGVVVTSDGRRASECGMYFGTSANSLTKLGSDTINAANMPFYYGVRKYGRTLEPGTIYYYQAYAIVDSVTYWGQVESFTTAKN